MGQGPALLVLNGGHTNCDSPLGHEQFFLDQGYQLLIPSRPGYGRIPSSTGKTAEAFADALVSLLDQLHLDHVIVVGISAAGPTALQLAGRAVIYRLKITVFQITCHATKRFQRIGSLT